MDGTSYEVSFNTGNVQARYHWWEEPPAGWMPLSRWLHETIAALEEREESE